MENSTVFQIFQKHFAPVPVPRQPGSHYVFRTATRLPAGRVAILVQVQADHLGREDEHLQLSVADLVSRETYATLRTNLAECQGAKLDELILIADLPEAAHAEIVGESSAPPTSIRLRHLKVVSVDHGEVSLATFRNNCVPFDLRALNAVFIGSTNRCNANCPHCPTNKKMTAHEPRGVMSMAIFEKLVDGLSGIEIRRNVLFGVFGEPFEDPLLEERIKLLRARRPDVNIDIASNGALASPERVAHIIDDIQRIGIHVEASTPAIYDKLMSPLRAQDVFPNIEKLIEAFGTKIKLTTPLHGGNAHEVPSLRQRWSRPGAEVVFAPVQTRSTDKTLAKRVCLGPAPAFWGPDLLRIMVVDWDGMVLTTCDDFLRRQPLGNLNESTVPEILSGEKRRSVFDALCDHRWSDLPSVTDAIVDDIEVTRSFANVSPRTSHWSLDGRSLRRGAGAKLVGDDIQLGAPGANAAVFGPYLALPAGRYHATFSGRVADTAAAPRILLEVAAGFGRQRYAAAEPSDMQAGRFDIGMEFDHRQPDQSVEFRVFARGGETGAVTLREVRVSRLDAGVC